MASSNEIKYNKEKLLGLGGNAAVFEGTFGEQQVAVKRVQIIRKNDRERTLHKLDHLNVVKLYGSSKEEDFVLYALELCAANLHDYCTGKYSGPMLTETEAMIQMADGLNYIHSKNFVHRDLKPENILISYGNPVHMKISDFGFSKPISNSGSYPLSGTFIGTEGWLAPELLQLYDINNTECANDLYKRATYTSDIFALGCVFFYFLVRSHPFGEKMTEISNNISKNYPVRWLDIVRLDNTGLEFFLIRQMIRVKPEQRISLNKVALVLRIDYAGNMLQNGRSSSYDGSDARSMRNGTEWNNYKINQTYQPQQENRVHLQQHGNRHTAEQSASRPSRDVVKQKPVVGPPTQVIKKKSSVQEVVSKVSKLLKPKKRHSKRNSTSDLHSSLPAIEEDRGSSVSVSTQSLSSENSQFREDLQLAGNEFVDEVNVGKSPYLAKGSQSPDDELPNIMATVSTQQQSSPSAAITINSLPFQERLQSNGDDVSDKYKSHNGVHFAREINKTWSLRLPTKPNTSFNNRRNSVGASGMVSNRLKFFESISQSSASGLNILSNKKSISGSATSTVKKNT